MTPTEAILAASLDAILTVDAQQRLTCFNPAAERLFGWSATEVLGQPLDVLLPPDRRERHRGLAAAFAGGVEQTRLMTPGRWVEALHRDGRVFPVSISISRTDEQPPTLIAIIRDATAEQQFRQDLHQARQEAVEASAATRRTLATMNHEIRTPLNGILGLLQQVQRSPAITPDLADRLRLVHDSAESLVHLLDDALELARSESGHLPIDPIPVHLARELCQVHALFESRAQEVGLQYRCEGLDTLPARVRVDPLRLRQVVANLMGNALKFTTAGEVVLAARVEEAPGNAWLQVTIRDSGIGVPAEARERIFQPFEQAHDHTARAYGGTGLGLAIVKRLVEAQGGTITVTDAVPRGACFTVRLPVEVLAPTAAAHPSGRVLVVDDEEVNRLVAQDLLTHLGHQAVAVVSAEEALAVADQGPWTAILLDLHLPGLSGLAALDALRERCAQAGATVPILAMTGSTLPEEVTAWYRAGFAAVVPKPLRDDVVASALAGALTATVAGPALDVAHLERLHRRGLVPDLLATFRGSLDERFRRLAEVQGPAAIDALHALTGAAASMGCSAVAQEARALQRLVAHGSPLAEDDLRHLRRACDRDLVAVERWLSEQARRP